MGNSGITVGVLVGNPRRESRTATVAVEVGRRVADVLGGRVGPVVDLAMHGGDVLDPDSAPVQRDMERVSRVHTLVVASPTYKATYTGLLKAFFDRFGAVSLDGVAAVPVMVGGAAHHAMAGEVHLRPLLVELGAVVPTRSLYVVDSELDHLTDTVSDWLSRERASLTQALHTVPA